MSRWQFTPESFERALDGAYRVALAGFPGVEAVEQLVASYRATPGNAREQAQRLVRWQIAKASTAGFITGLGGLITMPVALPVNVAGVLFVQSRMIAAVAALAGLDPRSDQVKTLVFACMAGKSALGLLEGTGFLVGEKLAVRAIKSISGKTLIAINKRVGFRLVAKFGERSVVNFGKMVPLVGGFVGAGFDGISTKLAGEAAIRLFHAPAVDAEGGESVAPT